VALQRLTELGVFSGTLLITQQGRVLLEADHGEADATFGISNTPAAICRIGSICKQISAAAILHLKSMA
jgi:CubicO group peptidase (beta-lactamase class C family)